MEHARRDGVKVHGFVLVPCCVHKCPCSEVGSLPISFY